MSGEITDAITAQRRYYTNTAAHYDDMHAHEADEWSMRLVCALLRLIDAKSILDVGAGTGHGVGRIQADLPGAFVCGVEPVAALIDRAVSKGTDLSCNFVQGSGEALPFENRRFDAVCSFAMLHHVPKPSVVVGEMLRVARKAVIILDSNRFGQGRWPIRAVKLALYKGRLWPLVNYFKTRGKGYAYTEGDGVAYSYSAYDSFIQIAAWADRLIVLPAERVKASSWLHPLLTAGGVLIGAFRDTDT